MGENINKNANIQEMNDAELESVVGVFSAGDQIVYKEYTKCPGCRGSIPSATLQFYRGHDPNSERAWIVKTNCCGTLYLCVESDISLKQ